VKLDVSTGRSRSARPLQELRAGKVEVRREIRRDSAGAEHSYYAYRVKHKAWAESAGPFDPGRVQVVVEYPLRLGRDRFSLFHDVRITRSRTLVAAARRPDLLIKPIPTEGRPAFYTGAVGRFGFEVTAKPTNVRVGDPITLTLKIRGTGRLETLAPPPLARLPELTADFKVPDEELAGVVQGSTKIFTQSIRARSDRVRAIPAIPFAFFDPKAGAFRVVRSKPIPLTVRPEVKLDAARVVEATRPEAVGLLTEQSAGILANYTDMDEVLACQDFALTWSWGAFLAAPPALYGLAWLVQRRVRRLREDVALARRRSAARTALRRLQQAGRLREEGACYRQVWAALLGYVADRYNLPVGGLTPADAVHTLRANGAPQELVAECEQILAACEQAQFAGLGSASAAETLDRARRWLRDFEKIRC